MPHLEKTATANHSADLLFRLVDDVEKYPEFLPWCARANISEQSEQITQATLHLCYKGIQQQFTTRNHKTFPHTMHMHLVDGPFKHFIGVWQFIDIDKSHCRIDFCLDYTPTNFLIGTLISPLFNKMADTILDSFIQRADALYNTNNTV